jgi:cyclase
MMNLRVAIMVGGLAGTFIASAPGLAQGGFAPPEMALTKVRDNIYMIRSGFSGNVTVLLSDDGVALIDSKFAGDHDGIIGLIKDLTDQPVRYVINTHMHGDHTGGNALMQAENAEVISSLNARIIMAETQDAGLPNVTFDDHMRIYLGDMPIDLHYVGRGHTDGDIIVHLPEERIVVMGDLFALWGPYESVVHYAAGGSTRDWPRALEQALKLDFDTVIPGHSGLTEREQVEGYRDYLIRLGGMVREMNQADRSRDDIQAMIKAEFGWGGLSMGLGLDGIITEMQ